MAHHALFISDALTQFLTRTGPKDVDAATVTSTHYISDLIKSSRRDFLSTLQELDTKLDILEKTAAFIQEAIATLEELGGLSIRARNLMQETDGATKYKIKIDEAQNWYKLALEKLDKQVADFAVTSQGEHINLLKGEKIETRFDASGSASLVTQGIDLSTQSIGLKAPDFSSLHAIQNARIDVANALDLAVTLRNIVTADISTIKVRREFCETSILLLSQI